MIEICKHLLPIYEHELKLSNPTNSPYLNYGKVILTTNFRNKMDIEYELYHLDLSPLIFFYELTDPHYELLMGFGCKECNQMILGPSCRRMPDGSLKPLDFKINREIQRN